MAKFKFISMDRMFEVLNGLEFEDAVLGILNPQQLFSFSSQEEYMIISCCIERAVVLATGDEDKKKLLPVLLESARTTYFRSVFVDSLREFANIVVYTGLPVLLDEDLRKLVKVCLNGNTPSNIPMSQGMWKAVFNLLTIYPHLYYKE